MIYVERIHDEPKRKKISWGKDLSKYLIFSLQENAFEELMCFQRALRELISATDAIYAKQFEEFFVGLEGSFGGFHLSPRTINSSYIGKIVCVEGIVNKCKI
jgi:DNA replication licensing factor MCM3